MISHSYIALITYLAVVKIASMLGHYLFTGFILFLGGSEFESKQLVLLACLNTEELHEVASTDTTTSFSSKHSLDGGFIFADDKYAYNTFFNFIFF